MSNVDVNAERQYYHPKREVHDMVSLNTWESTNKVDNHGLYDDML